MTQKKPLKAIFIGTIAIVVGLLSSLPKERTEAAPLPDPASSEKVDFIKDIQPIFEKSCSDGAAAIRRPVRAGFVEATPLEDNPGKRSCLARLLRVTSTAGGWTWRSGSNADGGQLLQAAPDCLDPQLIDQGLIGRRARDSGSGGQETLGLHRPTMSELPINNETWVINPIDRFTSAAGEGGPLSIPRSRPSHLLRRLSLTLGLPPTIEEVDA
jgi:hypothetical protein